MPAGSHGVKGMIEGINHIGYRTDDLAAAPRFYHPTFGAEPYEELQGEDGWGLD